MKSCPYCAEEIRDAAIVCKHCRRDLPGVQAGTVVSERAAVLSESRREDKPAWTERANTSTSLRGVHGRRVLGLVAVAVGFVMAIASASTAGFGILALWLGLGFLLPGSSTVRWLGGFVLSLVIGGVGMVVVGTDRPSSHAATTPSANHQTCITADGKDCSPGAVPARSSVSAPPPTPPSRPATPEYDLALVSARGYESESGGYYFVEGRVKNISDRPLKNVTAVASWFDKGGEFIKADDALIDYNPILPGQTSTFKTITTGNPAMSRYNVEFKTLFGGSLAVDDQRRKKD